jgi:hypothetical protein
MLMNHMQTGANSNPPLREAFGDLVDPWEYLDDQFHPWASLQFRSERADGVARPIVRDENDLAAIRNTGRLLADTSPAAIGVLKNLTNYIIGTGFCYKAALRDGIEPSGEANRMLAAVQRVIGDFLEANDWPGDLERELFLRSRRDGEYFVAMFPAGASLQLRVIEPEQVAAPHNSGALEEWLGVDTPSSWSFGVHSDEADIQNVHGYHVMWNSSGTDWDYLPVEMVEHLKLNVDRNVKRGISDFYAVRSHLEDAERLLRNTRQGAAVQAAIAFIREHAPGTTHTQIESLQQSLATRTYVEATSTGTRTRKVQRYAPGTILDISRGLQYKPGPLGASHGPNFLTIEQAVLRMAGVRWCLPEHMISGDASNNNYASILEAGAPFVKNAEAEQQFYAKRWRRMLWRVIEHASRSGAIGADLSTIRDLIEICIEPPEVAVRDRVQETQRRKLLFDAGILSPQTWAAKEGLDYEREIANRESQP